MFWISYGKRKPNTENSIKIWIYSLEIGFWQKREHKCMHMHIHAHERTHVHTYTHTQIHTNTPHKKFHIPQERQHRYYKMQSDTHETCTLFAIIGNKS